MSEYADIKIRKLIVYTLRNYFENDIVSLSFFKRDQVIIPDYRETADSARYTRYLYKTTVQNAKERFDSLGYGLSGFEELFNEDAFDAIDFPECLDYTNLNCEEKDRKVQKKLLKASCNI